MQRYVRRTRKRMGLSRLLLLPALLGLFSYALPGCMESGNKAEPAAAVTEISLAVAHDCPIGALGVLEAFCDNAATLSGGSLKVLLQYWDDPLATQSDMAFVDSVRLASSTTALGALRADYLFSSYEHVRAALSSPEILTAISDSLKGSGAYSAVGALYCGRQYLVCTKEAGRFLSALQQDDASLIQMAVEDVYMDVTPLVPLDLSKTADRNTLYYADTIALSGLTQGQTAGYTLLNSDYRYNMGFLFFSAALPDKLDPAQMASLHEAAAIALPASEEVYAGLDAAVLRGFSSVFTPNQKLRRAIRDLQSQQKNEALQSILYSLIDNYRA